MNHIVRSYLIQLARTENKIKYYSDLVKDCKLKINLTTQEGRNELSNILGEISTFEYNQSPSRPLLSSLVIYKTENDHGNGFYNLAEQLGIGKAKKLKQNFWGFKEADRCMTFWQNENNYKKYSLVDCTNLFSAPDYFNIGELNFFKKWQSMPYDPENPKHIQAKEILMETVWEKNIYLASEINKRLKGFELEGKKIWHQKGWKKNNEGQNIPCSIFKWYTWVKLFRNNERDKDIFFTFGVDASPEYESFIYKIDFQSNETSSLSKTQQDLCKQLIPDWNYIPFEQLVLKDWDALIDDCINYVNKNIALYDATIDSVWGKSIRPNMYKNKLIKRDKPQNGYASFPDKKKNFNGVDKNFFEANKAQKELGDAGEELVKEHEMTLLKSIGLKNKADKVIIVKDGMGYDVLSFDENGKEKFIEVKTTTGNELMPLYMSDNELAFMQENKSQYSLYRVYNYNSEKNFGEFYELTGDVNSQLLMKPIQFQVLIKKEN